MAEDGDGDTSLERNAVIDLVPETGKPSTGRLFTAVLPDEVLRMPSLGIFVLFRIPAQPNISERGNAVLAAAFDQFRHHLENLQMPVAKRHLRQRANIFFSVVSDFDSSILGA
ncbi:hypothetical protein [Rhizobium binxianense]|uniref:hypothetical protein n=1 Tax=Rhizobium binxianense TaxID=3024242 RepID=UPI00234F6F7A|nr:MULTISPECIES: hypothetical protein [unclassified Rhizobium]MDC7741430.1 hypothetical protein [Rhizobium sp. BC56]MDC9834145.1 hypothetical protein [Rhizobium sp. MJ37]